jgi:hypothetical protein
MLVAAIAVAQSPSVSGAATAADSATVDSTAAAQTGAERESGLTVGHDERVRIKEMLQRMGRSEVEGERLWERRKSGRVAMLSSALLPGLGQVYNGRRIKVAVMVGVASGYIAQIWLNHKAGQRARAQRDRLTPGTRLYDFQNRLSKFYEDEARTWGWWTGAVWIIGILDAWTDAHLYDIRAYTPPDEDELSGLSNEIPVDRSVSYLTFSVGF